MDPQDGHAYPRWHASATAVDGRIYVLGGVLHNWVGPSAHVEVYDPATDTWEQRADMPPRTFLSGVAVVDGVIYLVGGTWTMNVMVKYAPETDTWENAPGGLANGRYALGPWGRQGISTR